MLNSKSNNRTSTSECLLMFLKVFLKAFLQSPMRQWFPDFPGSWCPIASASQVRQGSPSWISRNIVAPKSHEISHEFQDGSIRKNRKEGQERPSTPLWVCDTTKVLGPTWEPLRIRGRCQSCFHFPCTVLSFPRQMLLPLHKWTTAGGGETHLR